MTDEQSPEEWELEKYQGWNKFNNLRSMTTSDMYVSDEDENVVALIVGEKVFLNADYIESIYAYSKKAHGLPEATKRRHARPHGGYVGPDVGVSANVHEPGKSSWLS